MDKHFVTFLLPLTFLAEATVKPIDSWDIEMAKEMATQITERYNAVPYGFKFSTRGRSDDELDSRVIRESPMYYINCEVVTLEQIKARNDPKESILIDNMECNGWDRVVQTTKGWKWTQPLKKDDVVLT